MCADFLAQIHLKALSQGLSQYPILLRQPDYITVVICSPCLDVPFVLTETFTVE